MDEFTERQDLQLRGSPTRCPFCHDDVALDEANWVACAGCLARHHASCWNEHGCCGSCGSTETLVRRENERAPPTEVLERSVGSPTGRFLLGGPRRIVFEATLPGSTREEAYPAVLHEIRTTLGIVGSASTVGSTLTWTATNTSRQVQVTVTPLGPRTILRVEEDLAPMLGGLFGGLGAGLGFPVAVVLAALLIANSVVPFWTGILTAVGCLVACLALARTISGLSTPGRERELAGLAERVAALLGERTRPGVAKEVPDSSMEP